MFEWKHHFPCAAEHLRIDSGCFFPLLNVKFVVLSMLLRCWWNSSTCSVSTSEDHWHIPIPESSFCIQSLQGDSVLQFPSQSLRITLLSLVLDGNGLKMSLIVNPILSFNHLFYTNFIFAVDVAKSVGIFLKRLTTSNSMSSSGRMLCLLINSMKLDGFLITGEVFWKSIKTEDAHSKRELMWVEVHMQTHKGSTISAKRYVKLTK